MKISMILPCFNGASTIRQQMEALCNQSWAGGWEVIVSNNGSTDNSMEIVEEYRQRLPELKIVQAYQSPGPRLGAFHSYNVGFQAATGDAYVMCESDDEVGEGWLEAMGQALLKHDFVVARLDYRKLNPAWVLPPPNQGYQETEIPQLDCHPYLQYAWGCSFGFRRTVYEKLGEFRPEFSYVFDSDYCWRAQLAGFHLHLVPEAVMHYRLRHELKALFNQKLRWGEDFKLLMRCYGAPPGKFIWIRSRLKLLRLLFVGIVSLPGYWLGVPESQRSLFAVAENLGWVIGEMKAAKRPLPFEISVQQ
ncbi:MAG: glycosyltransferase family 2 protein [Oscillatoriales cyanobacterium RM2_1_1]|nr:glycosyltransferase family 2 protein [Oscillatoriales cyanobacterium RM2_1_1]